ncbi:MAG TPA: efflux RND transporter permease subunit [Kofleriaceae bacterium]|jgi:multidrug efflux pump|nr:efflux RND transporter permease subunit [Kofleriaceae bacterium]
MLARFFANRPVFAWVISIVIMLVGIAAIRALPIAQFPNVAAPSVNVGANYPGASAETVENSVTQVLEQQLTGIDGILYFSSSSNSAGHAGMSITFKQGTNPDTAQVQVQNKVQQAIPRLPSAVQQQGIVVTKAQNSFLLVVGVADTSNRATEGDIADYIASTMQDPIARVDGVGSIEVFGASYAMRIWLDPAKLGSYGLMPSDVEAAVAAQNVQVSAGKIGQQPAPPGQQLNATVTAQSKLRTAEEFRAIIVKYQPTGATVRLSDVARVELGSESYDIAVRLNGYPASGFAVSLAPGANAMATAEAVKAVANRLAQTMPAGWKVSFPFDTTTFIRISIKEVVKTLIEAIVLVVLVMFLFLQSWRATLIPVIAVPVVMLGTFGVLQLLGYSINTLTMFGMVLSIGLLVDDAIVVVENVERLMRDEKLSPLDATVRSMKEITGALIGVATVLSAVFLPMAFFSGSTGVIYRQFSITIAASMLLSVLVALTITPAMCASLLRGTAHHTGPRRGLFGWFNRGFDALARRYQGGVARMARGPVRWLIPYAGIVGAMVLLLQRMPTGFLPSEDQGIGIAIWTLPSGASLSRTNAVARAVEHHFLEVEKSNVDSLFTVSGFSFVGVGQNAGMAFISLKDWEQRPGKDNTAAAITGRATGMLSVVRDAQIFSLTLPPIQGLGNAEGFELELQALPGTDRAELARSRDLLLANAAKDPKLLAVRRGDLGETPQLKIDIDQAKALAHGVALSDVSSTLTAAWGGAYINDFIDRGRVKRVFMQGDAPFRSKPEDLDAWYVRGNNGAMTPFAAFATTHWAYGAETLSRYNGLASYTIQGMGAPGVASGDAIDEVERVVKALPAGTTYAWSGLSYEERLASGQTLSLYAISILVIFLCLAALYESWSVPFSVLLVIPLGVVGAVLAASLRGLENDVYFRVALLTTIGLAAKNAILIVEFAENAYQRGVSLVDAAITGAKLRLRPIVMTSLAFVAGVLPLAVSTGAGANSRVSIGTGIVGGTVTGTILAIFLVPVFFVVVRKLVRGKRVAA